MRIEWILLAVSALSPGLGEGAERWRVQYLYDEDTSSLTLLDLKFPSPQRGVAVGYLTESGRTRPVALITGDGGEHWSLEKIPEPGVSLFFLNDSLGWMVTRNGVWRTDEGGRSWKRLARLRELVSIYFQDAKHGWAVGHPKAVHETWDGGEHWSPVAAAAQPKTTPEFTTYGWIDFVGSQVGLIAGSSRPPRRDQRARFPSWMDPDESQWRREWPTLTIFLETRDGGRSWSSSQASMFGTITRVRLGSDGRGLGLIQFSDSFAWPSEVFQLDLRTGNSKRVFRQKDRLVTDLALLPQGPGYLAGVEPQGTLWQAPIPGKLKILRSNDLLRWEEMEVDYRASGHRAVLAVADPTHIWAGTDTGIILKLIRE
jgi:hypothetical protein